MSRHAKSEVECEAFANRLTLALEQNPNAPPKFKGERVWLRDQLAQRGIDISTETARKWLVGKNIPTVDKVRVLGDVLNVDWHWLLDGTDDNLTFQPLDVQPDVELQSDSEAVISMVGAIIRFHGSRVEPAPENSGAHLTAVIQSVRYPLHVIQGTSEGSEVVFSYPKDFTDAIVLVVVPRALCFACDILEVRIDELEKPTKGNTVKVPMRELKRVNSFAQRF